MPLLGFGIRSLQENFGRADAAFEYTGVCLDLSRYVAIRLVLT